VLHLTIIQLGCLTKMSEPYEILSDLHAAMRLQFVSSSRYVRRFDNRATAEVLLDDDPSFTFDVHVLAVIESGEKQKLYTFSCGGRALCASSADGVLKFEESGSQETNDASYFIGVPVNDCDAFKSELFKSSYIAYDDEGRVTLKETSSTDTKAHLRLTQLR